MTDEQLIAAMRESFTGVGSTTPVEQIVSRSRAVRARRRIPAVSGAVAVVAAAAIALPALLPAQRSGHPASARLAAWTVARQPGGNIYVTIRELRDPAGLQSTLRADGVPASVRFFPVRGRPNPCRGYDGSQALYRKVLQPLRPSRPEAQYATLIIHPSALPRDAGVGLQVTGTRSAGIRVGLALVQASSQCTGS